MTGMRALDIVCSMMAGASLSLGLMSFLVWLRDRRQSEYLALLVFALAVCMIVTCELSLVRASDAAHYADVLRCRYVPVVIGVIALMVFVRKHLGTGRTWLLWPACAASVLVVFADYASGTSLDYLQVTELRPVATWAGEISVGTGV